MSIAHVVTGSAASANTNTAVVTINSTGGDFLGLWTADYDAVGQGGMSDNKGNTTWNAGVLTPRIGAASNRGKLWFHANAVCGTSHTITYTTVGGYPTLYVVVFSGVHLTAPYTGVENGATADPAATLSTGSVTPPENGCLILTGAANNDTERVFVGIDEGFTIAAQILQAGGTNFGGGIGYLLQTTAAAVNPTWDIGSGGAALAAAAAVFKPAAGGGGGEPTPSVIFPRWSSVRR